MRSAPLVLSAIGCCYGFAAPPAVAEEPAGLAGVWSLQTFVSEDVESKERQAVFGSHPNGYLVLTPSGRLFAILTAEQRAPPLTDADRISAFGSMVAYSGKYHVDGTTFTTKVDIAWNQEWVGTDQVRHYRIEGDTLYIETVPQPNASYGGRTMRFFLSWEREN